MHAGQRAESWSSEQAGEKSGKKKSDEGRRRRCGLGDRKVHGLSARLRLRREAETPPGSLLGRWAGYVHLKPRAGTTGPQGDEHSISETLDSPTVK